MPNYGWICTRDHEFERSIDPLPDAYNRVGVKGPYGLSPEIEARLDRGEGIRWRTRYGIGNPDPEDNYICHEGLLIDDDEEHSFAPLDDLSRPDVGAGVIEHYEKGKGWTPL